MSLAGSICFSLARRIVQARKTGEAGANPATFDVAAYQRWRDDELRGQFTEHFRFDEIVGKDVLDFGCGGGALSVLLAQQGARSVTAVDLNPQMIAQAQAYVAQRALPNPPRIVQATDVNRIDFPAESFDVILCFDVLEHILSYRAIIPEWRRVLRPGGVVMIWWVPWLNPYGHHIESLVPLPWAHVLFSERALTEACARMYDSPEFTPRWWDLDEQGQRKPNKWRTMQELPDLNRLTIGAFETLVTQTGLHVQTREIVGFGGSSLGRLTRPLTQLPGLREFFCSRVMYRLQK